MAPIKTEMACQIFYKTGQYETSQKSTLQILNCLMCTAR